MARGLVVTEAMLDFLKEHRPSTEMSKLTVLFNERFDKDISSDNLQQICLRRGIFHKDGKRFMKGQTPWNAGKKGYMGANVTSFKKNTVPPNRLPVGSERIDSEGYVYIKIAEGLRQFRLKHHVVWQAVNGAIPKSHVLVFVDGNKLNCDYDNLVLVSRNELAVLNRHENFSKQPVEVRRSLIALVRLEQTGKKKAA
jgi:hypothetical protein